MCKLDAVIDYGSLSLTARHMETVIVFRHARTNTHEGFENVKKLLEFRSFHELELFSPFIGFLLQVYIFLYYINLIV